jgi:predicted nucleic acid-binding protein
MIFLDTSVLSLVFRRGERENSVVQAYQKLVRQRAPLAIPGIVLQEVLCGTRTSKQFDLLRHALSGFDIWLATARDHIEAALLANRCRDHGISCSAPDALIATIAIDANANLFTTDKDFQRIAHHEALILFDFQTYGQEL